jgi:hypothetical protein
MRLTRSRNDHGVALITVLMMLTLISAMLVATTALVIKDQKARFQDHNRTDTFYAALAGLEKITNDLGSLFSKNYAPSQADLATVTANPPTLGQMKFEIPGGGARSGYTIEKGVTNPDATIQTGPLTGLKGMITPYVINVTAQSPAGSESSLRREVNLIAVPVFQFGIFSETDLSFFPGPNFNFGGRVHTNGNLYLAKDDNGNQLILNDYVTAFKDVIRHTMANGNPTTPQYDGIVKIATANNGCADTAAATCRQIALNEGSVDSNMVHNEAFHAISLNTYSGYIKHGANDADHADGTAMGTGAVRLELPITQDGSPAISLIRRPAVGEHVDNPGLYDQRYYTMASIRILLSDRPEDLDNLPGKSAPNAQPLSNWYNAQAGGNYAGPWPANYPASPTSTPSAPYLPFSTSPYYRNSNWPYTNPEGTPLVDGYIKIEMQNQAGGTWTDVTSDIMALGYWGETLSPTSGTGYCAGSTTAVIRIQRFKDNAPTGCSTTDRRNFWSNTLYDAREGAVRDDNTTYSNNNQPLNYTRMYLGGIMHYVELDIRNLRTWLAARRQTNSIMETTGYVVYFSDRRGNHNDTTGLPETGEYGWEDVVHPGGTTPHTGEDVNGNGSLQTYGGKPWVPATNTTYWNPTNTASRAPFRSDARVSDLALLSPNTTWHSEKIARASRPIFFRRALKLVNGNRQNMLIDTAGRTRLGLTVVSENPVYIHGDYNATTSEGVPQTYENEHVACAVIADAVTLLSNQWSDRNSFLYPHSPNQRTGNTTTYRTAVISGKGMAFPRPSGLAQDFGTDGGTHNFLRYLEAGSRTLNYKGSIVSLYYNAQATGTYKCCTNVYGAPTRAYSFDEDFRDPAKLPPRTPMFRTVDVTNFTRLSEPPETQNP